MASRPRNDELEEVVSVTSEARARTPTALYTFGPPMFTPETKLVESVTIRIAQINDQVHFCIVRFRELDDYCASLTG